jgi:hypothetical protein
VTTTVRRWTDSLDDDDEGVGKRVQRQKKNSKTKREKNLYKPIL